MFPRRNCNWTIILLNRQEKWNGVRESRRAPKVFCRHADQRLRPSLALQNAEESVAVQSFKWAWRPSLEKPRVKAQDQSATGSAPGLDGVRHDPRFKLEVEISIRTRTHGVLAGYTVDISESGISAILKIEVPLSEIVELGFMVPIGRVNIPAMVRQRDCFRYGFQFIGSGAAQEVIRSTCRQLAVEQSLSRDQAFH
jgi:hypothetical protein